MEYIQTEHIENRNNKKITLLYIGFIALTALISTLMLISNSNNYEYQLLPILPITFGVCSCFFISIYEYVFKSWSITLIIGIYYFRLVIIPIIMFFGDYSSLILNNRVYTNMNTTILLLVYEVVSVFLTLSLRLKEVSFPSKSLEIKNYNIFNTKSRFFKVIFVAMISFELFCVLLFPELSAYTNFFISSSLEGSIKQAQEFLYMTKIVPGIIYRLYAFIFNILQIIVPVIVIQYIYKKYSKEKKLKAVFFSLFVIFISITIMTPEKANSILIGVNLFLLIFYMYPRIIRKIFPFAFLIGIFIIFGGLVLKAGANHTGDIFKSLSSILTAYFGGPANVSVAVSMNHYANTSTFFSDIVSSIPFVSYFFTDLITTPKMFNLTLYGNSNSGDQIIPMIGQGFYYFGFILAPLFTFLCVNISMKLEKYAKKSLDVFSKYIFMYGSTIFALSPVIYNLNIVITTSFNIIVVLVIAYISRKKIIFQKKR